MTSISTYSAQNILECAADLLNISSTIACHGCVCLIQSCTQCTMHNAHCTMHNAQCPMHNAHVKLQSCMERISVDEFGLQACSLRLLPLCRLQCASLSLSYHFFHRDWLHGWLQLPVITGQVAKNDMEWIKIPGNLLPAQDYHILISAELALNVFAKHAHYLSSAVRLACPPI